MNDTRARFVILLLGAPEILEGAERSQNRSTNPYRVLSLGRRDNLDLRKKKYHEPRIGIMIYIYKVDKPLCLMVTNSPVPSACDRRYQGTWWSLLRGQRFHTDHDGYRDHTWISSYSYEKKISKNISLLLINCSLRSLVDTLSFKSKHGGLEKGLWRSESEHPCRYMQVTKSWVLIQNIPFVADGNDLSIR